MHPKPTLYPKLCTLNNYSAQVIEEVSPEEATRLERDKNRRLMRALPKTLYPIPCT